MTSKKNGSYNIGLNHAKQLIMITKLLDEAVANPEPLGNACLATQEDLRHAVDNIKALIGTQPYGHLAFPTYASATRGLTEPFHPLTMKPVASTEAQERDIFVSLKNTDKNSTFIMAPPTTLTDKLIELLAEYFRNPSNGGLDVPMPIRSTSRLANSYIILTFKTKDGAQCARAHIEGWVKLIEPRATALHRTYAVVVHNVPSQIWSNPMVLQEAMTKIETSNTDVAPIDFTLANMVWVNSQDACNKTGRGPLMLSFKSKNAANAAIDSNIAIHGVTCSVSIYIPQPPQCFQCQDWGTMRWSALGRSAAAAVQAHMPQPSMHACMTTHVLPE